MHPERRSALALQKELGQDALDSALTQASNLILSQQSSEGFWWYTLEANDTINAEYIFLTHYIDHVDRVREAALARQILSSQNPDGSWSIYYAGAGDISATIEAYFALKLAGHDTHSAPMAKARQFILSQGGLSQCRIFTRIHLALFGIIPWDACPTMPLSFIHFPSWFPINLYEFSSWARACVVPLLVIMDQKKTRALPAGYLDELLIERSVDECDWSFKTNKGLFSAERFFIEMDKLLRKTSHFSVQNLREKSMQACDQWIRDHLEKTEDIYPFLAYSAMALSVMGYAITHPLMQKALNGLLKFQMPSAGGLEALPERSEGSHVYQQCSLSPVWDTPWAGVALLESGVPANTESLQKTARWLISKQILSFYGDWSVKNKRSLPGGWSFEFENEYFPDVDDTIQVLNFLEQVDIPQDEKAKAIERGVSWMLSMQSKNGGWAAFDVDNTKEIVNKIPFSDHGACLDPPTADITARAIEYLASTDRHDYSSIIKRGISFIESKQEKWGAWSGRWGVNYLYGTWCVLQGLAAVGYDMRSERIQKAVNWLLSVQRPDGGFGESCHSYVTQQYEPLPESVASQTAWALMGLVAAGQAKSPAAERAASFLVENQTESGGWNESYFTGTGFPGHFYIRYHGYRHYFPLLSLALYRKATEA